MFEGNLHRNRIRELVAHDAARDNKDALPNTEVDLGLQGAGKAVVIWRLSNKTRIRGSVSSAYQSLLPEVHRDVVIKVRGIRSHLGDGSLDSA